MPPPLPTINNVFDGCPMCGHLVMTTDGRCEACGENLRGVEGGEVRRGSLLNWRVFAGLIVFALFTWQAVVRYLKLNEVRFSDRTFHLLIIVSLSCGALCGFVLFVKGVLRARRS
jgi:hypothetical protein